MRKLPGSFVTSDISIGGVSLVQKAFFAKNLALSLKSGLPITQALDIARDSSSGKLRKVIGSVLASVESGHSLSKSFAEHEQVFSELFIKATYAGEISGTLDESFESIADQLEKEHDLVSKIKGAMFYPVIVLVVAIFMGVGFSLYILPKITPLFKRLRIELPAATKSLIWISQFMQENGIVVLIGMGLVTLASLVLWRQRFFRPVKDWFMIKTPLVGGLVKNLALARFSNGLATLLRTGLPIDESLEVTSKIAGNYYYQRTLEQTSHDIMSGVKLSANLAQSEHLFPKLVTRMIRVGEESGRLDEILSYLSEFYEREVDTRVKTLSTAIEPLLLILIGLVVAYLAMAIMMPIYQISGGIQR